MLTQFRARTLALYGWVCLLFATIYTYTSTPSTCSIFARLNFSESVGGSFLLALALVCFALSSYRSFREPAVSGEPTSSNLRRITVFILCAALVVAPFNTHDISFYYSASQYLAHGTDIYNVTWDSHNLFYCPTLTSQSFGFMYGPIDAFLLTTIFTVSGGSALLFVLLWKLLQALALYACMRAVQKLTASSSSNFIWFAQPLLIWEMVANGHFDLLWVACVLGALVWAKRDAWWLVFPVLAVGIWLKFVPALVVPFFLLWWWQSMRVSNWKPKLTSGLLGCVLGLAVTFGAWVQYWQGPQILAPIALQTKWAVSSVFASIYYTLEPAFQSLLHDRAHWVLTRMVQGALAVGVLYMLYPILASAWRSLTKKAIWQTSDFAAALLVFLLIYLGLWQKSFWPWYMGWVVPFGILAVQLKPGEALLRKIVAYTAATPVLFYLVWLVNHFTRHTDAPSELWFWWCVALGVWAYQLYQLWQWRKQRYGLSV